MQDYLKAFHYLKLASEAKKPSGEAMNYLAACYVNGRETVEDPEKCEYWRKKAAEYGDDDARAIVHAKRAEPHSRDSQLQTAVLRDTWVSIHALSG